MPSELKRLTRDQLLALPKEKTLFLYPLSVIEDHGPHLPLGTDLYLAERLTYLVAEKIETVWPEWKTVLLPSVPLSVDSATDQLALSMRGHIIRDYLVDTAQALYKSGFYQFAVITSTPGPRQLVAIEEAGQLLKLRLGFGLWGAMLKGKSKIPTLVSVQSAFTQASDLRHAFAWYSPHEHGGSTETSALAAISPQLINSVQASSLPRLDHTKPGILARLQKNVSGYWGNPAEHNELAGTTYLEESVSRMVAALHRVFVDQISPDRVFKSWYAAIPLNRSFFKSWILFIAVVVFLLATFFLGWLF